MAVLVAPSFFQKPPIRSLSHRPINQPQIALSKSCHLPEAVINTPPAKGGENCGLWVQPEQEGLCHNTISVTLTTPWQTISGGLGEGAVNRAWGGGASQTLLQYPISVQVGAATIHQRGPQSHHVKLCDPRQWKQPQGRVGH